MLGNDEYRKKHRLYKQFQQRLHNRNIKENMIQLILNTATSHRLTELNPYKPKS